MGLFLGLDIGVASVGYGIVNEYGRPVDAGVRLFPEGTSLENKTRRNRRHARRGLRRKHHRLERADHLFVRTGLAEYISGTDTLDLQCEPNITPYHLRVKGLREPLTDKELVIALRHMLKRRGSQPLNAIDDADEKKTSTVSTKAVIEKTRDELASGKYICEIQLERLLSKDGMVRGVENRFLTSDYEVEARQILSTQKQHNQKVTDEFVDSYLQLLSGRRPYYVGPGEQSPFAWNSTEEWMERLMGKCVYTGDIRIVKHAPTAEMFNLLNDLNNMKIDGKHLSNDEKKLLINEVFLKQKTSPSVFSVLKKLGYPKSSEVTGLRVSKSGKQIFTTLPGYRYLLEVNEKSGGYIDKENYALLDEVARILTIYQEKDDAAKMLSDLDLTEAFISLVTDIYDDPSLCNTFKGTHSLSRKAIMLIWDDLWNTPKNQMELFNEKKIVPQHGKICTKNGRIIPEIVEDMAVSPVARRAISQAFTVFNDLLDKYPCGFERVTIEMAREKNSEDQKKWIEKMQEKNEKINAEVLGRLSGQQGSGLFSKVRLLILQEEKDIYTGDPISIDDLKANPYAYEIDHIIPLSISFDDSQSNKVLTSSKNNQAKGQRTPYQWMMDSDAPDFAKFSNLVRAVPDKQHMPAKKKENLLFTEDITKWDVQKRFVNRNLVDTRYACKEVVLAMKSCLAGTPTIVQTVNGSFTHYLRKCWGLNKDRDESYAHHAIDALIVAASSLVQRSLPAFKRYELCETEKNTFVVDKQTGEIIEDCAEDMKAAVDQFKRYGREFAGFDKIKYSHKIDKKANRCLCNETIYSTRIVEDEGGPKEFKTEKINDLYAKANPSLMKRLRKLFVDDPNSCLMYESDRKSYDKLKSIYDEYIGDGKNNPFALYKAEHGFVTKNSKNGNGPPIKSLRYYSGAINGNPLDISHKYNCKDNKRVIMEGLTTYRVDVYKSAQKGYKVLRISPSMLSGSANGLRQLELEKEKQEISSEDTFKFSLYENDVFELDGNTYRFAGYSSENLVLMKLLSDDNLIRRRIGPSTSSVRLMHSNSLGIF